MNHIFWYSLLFFPFAFATASGQTLTLSEANQIILPGNNYPQELAIFNGTLAVQAIESSNEPIFNSHAFSYIVIQNGAKLIFNTDINGFTDILIKVRNTNQVVFQKSWDYSAVGLSILPFGFYDVQLISSSIIITVKIAKP